MIRANRTQAALDMAAEIRAFAAQCVAIRTREAVRPLLWRDIAKRAELVRALPIGERRTAEPRRARRTFDNRRDCH